MGEGASIWVVGVKVWYCDGWLANNPKKERKKQLVRCVVRQTIERKETSNNNLRFAAELERKEEEELASQQICSEEINNGKQWQGSEKIRQQNYSKATRRYSSKAIDFLLWYFGHYTILWGYFRNFILKETMKWNRRFEFKTYDFEKAAISCVPKTCIFVVFKNANF